MTPATVKKHGLAKLTAQCIVYDTAKKVMRRGPAGQPFTVQEDLLHGCFDGIGFDGERWLLAQWTSLAGMSARRKKIEAQFMGRIPLNSSRLSLAKTTRVELWGYVGRGVWRVQVWNWERWAWGHPFVGKEVKAA